MNTLLRLVTAFTAGAVAMYYLDPTTGRRRRALARDQGVAAGHDVEDFARAKSKRAAHRVQGAVAKTRAKISPEPVGDEQLRERIRAKLGRVVEHPGAVEVKVHDGRVVLSGSATKAEIDELNQTVSSMPGVEDVVSRLSANEENEKSSDSQDARH